MINRLLQLTFLSEPLVNYITIFYLVCSELWDNLVYPFLQFVCFPKKVMKLKENSAVFLPSCSSDSH